MISEQPTPSLPPAREAPQSQPHSLFLLSVVFLKAGQRPDELWESCFISPSTFPLSFPFPGSQDQEPTLRRIRAHPAAQRPRLSHGPRPPTAEPVLRICPLLPTCPPRVSLVTLRPRSGRDRTRVSSDTSSGPQPTCWPHRPAESEPTMQRWANRCVQPGALHKPLPGI